ncbi:hypothetical protein [Paenibacillus sp. 1001270B_150601_E10]|uniref:hypothetical protein n=1 Tax=Paenibacillus sp. 1001270B_150601_E10 TaxID=2787079 RepID=UPI00189DE940
MPINETHIFVILSMRMSPFSQKYPYYTIRQNKKKQLSHRQRGSEWNVIQVSARLEKCFQYIFDLLTMREYAIIHPCEEVHLMHVLISDSIK